MFITILEYQSRTMARISITKYMQSSFVVRGVEVKYN